MHDELRKLLRQSSQYLAGLIGSLAFGFISFPIFTRVFSVADYGLIDFAQKISVLVVALSKCGLQNSALRFYDRSAFDADPGAARRYYSTLLLSLAGPALLVSLLFGAFVAWSPRWLIDARLAGGLLFATGLIFLRPIQSLVWSFMRVEERTGAYNVYSLIIRGGTIAAVCLMLPWTGASVSTYFSGTLLVETIVVAVVVYPLFRRGVIKMSAVDPALRRTALAFGLPLIIQELAGIVLDSGDRAVIRHFLGDEPLGLYSVAYGLSSYVNTLLMLPLGLAIIPIYMRLWKDEGPERTGEFLSRGLDGFLMAAVLVQVLAALLARDAIAVLASVKYAAAAPLIPTLVAGMLFYTSQSFLNAGLLIHRRTRTLAVILIWSAALNVGLNWILIPLLGLRAAALATLVAYVFASIWTAYVSCRVLPLNMNLAATMKYLVAGIAAWLLGGLIDSGIPLWNLAGRTAVALAVYFLSLYATDPRIRSWVGQGLRAAIRSGSPALSTQQP